jgi:hypothetical protein
VKASPGSPFAMYYHLLKALLLPSSYQIVYCCCFCCFPCRYHTISPISPSPPTHLPSSPPHPPPNTSCTKLPIPHLWSKPNHQQLTPQLLLLLPLKQPQQQQPNNPVRLLLALCFWLLPITDCNSKELGQKKENTNKEAKISDTHTHSLSLSISLSDTHTHRRSTDRNQPVVHSKSKTDS